MKAGVYYVGDLCYVMHDEWREVCDLIFDSRHNCRDGEFELADGRRFAMYSTCYGDGMYFDQVGREYGVDSGSIGCILKDDIRESDENHSDGGNFVTFPDDFETYEENGSIFIGDVVIETNPSGEEEYDEFEEQDPYDD